MSQQSIRQDIAQDWARPIEAIAFDMDGLLVNTEDLYTEVGATLLRRRNRRFSRALKNAMTGLPGPQAFAVMIDWEGLDDTPEVLAAESNEVFANLLPDRLRLLPGAVTLFDHLDQLGLPRCVATSSSRQFADEVLEAVGVRSRVEFVITAADVPQGKPHPDIYLSAAERMQVPPASMLVLEDSHHGTRAGVRSGACTIAVPGPHSEDHDFTGVHLRAQTLADPRIYALISR